MEKKFFLKNGESIEIGDIIKTITTIKSVFGETRHIGTIQVTEKTLPNLLKSGIIIEDCSSGADTELDFYIQRIASRFKLEEEEVINLLSKTQELYPVVPFSIVLREIALYLDEKYEGHISDCPEVFIISTLNGRIEKVPTAKIKSFRNFAAFRTLEDARFACKVTRDILKTLFSEGK